MPRPTPADRHVDSLLSSVGQAFFQDPTNYVAMRAFPVAPVPKQSDQYRTYSIADLLRLEAQKMAPGTAAPKDTTGIADAAFFCEKYGLGDYLTPEDLANDDGPIDPEEVLIQALIQAHHTKMERAWATAFFGVGLWDTDWAGNAAPGANQFLFFDNAAGDPVDVVTQARRAVHNATGFKPNLAICGAAVMDHFKVNDAIQDRIKYTGAPGAKVTPQMLAGLFEVDEVLEASAIYNTAAEGAAAAMANICATEDMLLVYRSPTPSPRVPSAGYTFVWSAPSDAPAGTQVVVRKIPNPLEGNRTDYEAIIYWDMRQTSASLGAFLHDCLT